MRVDKETRAALRMIGFVFALGVAFQTGIGVASKFTPTVEVIEIHANPTEPGDMNPRG